MMAETLKTAVTQLFIHGQRGSRREDLAPTPMIPVERVDAVEQKGLLQDSRYFKNPDPGSERKRQVSLIDEGTIWRHERKYGPIDRSFIKAQIVLQGDIRLPELLGSTMAFEDGAELTLCLERIPCFAMDFIRPGLKDDMQQGNQGALAQVGQSGPILVGQRVLLYTTTTGVPTGAQSKM